MTSEIGNDGRYGFINEMSEDGIVMATFYQIRVKGHLDQRHEEWLAGFSMTLHPDGETILIGQVADQAALYGLLLRIRDLGIQLLSVNDVKSEHHETGI